MLSLILFVSLPKPSNALAAEPRMNAPEPFTLIILYSSEEFLVLRSTGTDVTWTAETGEPEAEARKAGLVQAGRVHVPVDLGKVFAQIASMKREVPRDPRKKIVVQGEIPGRFGKPVPLPPEIVPLNVFTLVLLDSNSVKTCVDLTPKQCSALRRSLAAVFDDVLEKSPFAFKMYLIRELLAPEDELKEVTHPTDRK